MPKCCYRLSILLLLLVSLTATAEDSLVQQGCRRGTPRPFTRSAAVVRLPGGDFYKGDLHQLVVLASFADRSFKDDEAQTLEQWDKIFNTENLSEEPFFGSVRDYFAAQSYDQFRPVFDLEYVVVDSLAKYRSTKTDDENSQFLVDDIVDSLLKRDIDWSLYDWNGDGYINQLLIIYAGKGSSYGSFGGGYDAIWPHQWWMSDHKDPETGVYRDPLVVTDYYGHDWFVDCYCAVQELASNDSYGAFGTLCHEYSHCFGFPDFYGGGGTKFVGNWDLMDYGNYNGDGFHPCGYSAHERWIMDWLTPEELTTTATITDMPALTDEGRAYLLRNDGYDQEYYIVENRQQRGWDQSLPGNGIVIFHVDFDPELWTSPYESANGGSVNHYEIFHANNKTSTYESSNWGYPYQANDSLTNTSKPAATLNNANIDGTKFMSKPITRMAVTDGLASFDVFIDTPSSILHLPSDFSHQSSVLYRLGPVTIVRDEKGRVHKIIARHSSPSLNSDTPKVFDVDPSPLTQNAGNAFVESP